MDKYFSSWTIHTMGFAGAFQEALTNNQIGSDWTVWRGSSGDAVVTEGDFLLDDDYADDIKDGIVSDYLND